MIITVIEQLTLPVGHTYADLEALVCKRLGLRDIQKCPAFEIIRRSTDARKKPDIFFVYSVKITDPDFRVPKNADKRHVKRQEEVVYKFGQAWDGRLSEGTFLKKTRQRTVPCLIEKYQTENRPLSGRPVIAGFGPAGMFCALELARAGFCPVVLERGSCVEKRTKDVERFFETGELDENSNVQFGEGGAGTFSDGKLNTGTGARGGRSAEVLKAFAAHGAPAEILYDNKPHIGTDILVNVVKSIRNEIISLGGEVLFDTQLTDISIQNGRVCGVMTRSTKTGEEKEIGTEMLVLAIGHSARDTFTMLYEKKVPMQQKAFAVGVRIEHPQSLIDEFMYGEAHERLRRKHGLSAADYKLTAHTKSGRGVYSFCMCPGGFVVNSSSVNGAVAVNGMSYNARSGRNANAALIVTVSGKDFGDGVLSGVSFQERLERAAYAECGGRVPVQLLGDFANNRMTKGLGTVEPCIKGDYAFGDLRAVLPDFVSDAIIECMEQFERRIPGYSMPDACLSGVESRTSSPVRILRDEHLMSQVAGLFPCGEGAGYAGGIMSSATDGIRCAEEVAREMAGMGR